VRDLLQKHVVLEQVSTSRTRRLLDQASRKARNRLSLPRLLVEPPSLREVAAIGLVGFWLGEAGRKAGNALGLPGLGIDAPALGKVGLARLDTLADDRAVEWCRVVDRNQAVEGISHCQPPIA
jgi:hypothetical protein